MSRNRFRSQPTLQRSGPGGRSPVLGLCILGAIGLGAGTLIGAQLREAPPSTPQVYAAGPTDQAATLPSLHVPAAALVAAAAPAPPPVQTVQADLGPQAAAPASVVKAKAKMPTKRSHKATSPNAPRSSAPCRST